MTAGSAFCIAQGWSNVQGCGAVPGRSTGGPPWAGEIPLLLMTIAYLGVILFLTSRRSQVTGGTLAIGAGTGLLFGVVMFAVAPLGLTSDASDPWLPGSTADPLVALAWILLFGGPAAAAALAAWLLHWLNHGHQLTAIAAYRYEATASSGAAMYLFMLIWFPVIGLLMSALGAACTPSGRPAPRELTA